ncbi:MAG: hypothetical protein J6A73_05995 [Lachnospiraceae bacterium]|nr:hypothetical protein [Lachnospiraceae bacterium]
MSKLKREDLKMGRTNIILKSDVKIEMKVERTINCQINITSQLARMHWFMHEHDNDINDPSCPHCHSMEGNHKLDIYSGNIYEYPKKKYKSKLSKKEMKTLWEEEGFLELVLKEREWYNENYHKKNPRRYPALPPLPITQKHNKSIIRVTRRWMSRNEKRICK